MPTILFLYGWRFYFYSNENNEPIHIHCRRGDSECKYWIDVDNYELIEAFSFNLNPNDKRLLRKTIFDNFEYIVQEWNKCKETLK